LGSLDGLQQPEKIIMLSSWKEAIEYCTSEVWDNLQFEASNQYCERLIQRTPERFKVWNDVVRSVKTIAYDLADRKIERVMKEEKLPRGFQGCVRTDVQGMLIEAEYADVIQPGFSTAMGYWYTTGHFPCGWVGETPDALPPHGKLVVY
jgi:hypothetical protein